MVLTGAAPSVAERPLFVELMRRYSVRAWDGSALVDLRSGGPKIRELRFVEPGWLRRRRTEEVAGPFLLCAYVDTQLAPPADLPNAPTPPPSSTDVVACHHNFQILRGDLGRARDDIARWRAAPDGPRGPEAALGAYGRVLGFRVHGRTGADVWWTVDRAPPDGAVLRWRVEPAAGGESLVEEHAAWPALSGRPPLRGFVAIDHITWSLPQGSYRLSVELGPPAPPAGAGAPPPALGAAALGTVEL
ncbi:hypothetical protein [Sorangium sp. So ce1182]|uniref:hypothetical protein n=1 Tax=Sorangium sp. So ce1182 TaxID=3133334 RepID=UPI003F6483F9